jgi:hypothetical protein
MNQITYEQAFELIDTAAREDRVYHYNGGQCYIRLENNSNVLMVVDHAGDLQITLTDGTEYFETYKNFNLAASKNLRDSGSMVDWYKSLRTSVNN